VLPRTRSLAVLVLVGFARLAGAQGAESLYQSGTRAFQDGLYLMAGRSFRQLAEQYPDSPFADDAAYLRALAEFYREEYRDALALFRELPRRYPQSPFVRQVPFWAGCSFYRLGQYPEAVGQLILQSEKFPEEREYAERALQLAGSAQEKLELWAEAQKTYRRLLERKPPPDLEAEAWFRLASAQLQMRDYPAALASFTRVLVDYPDAPQAGEALFYAAESLYFAGRYAEAERRFRLALDGLTQQTSSAGERRETCLYRLARIQARLERPAEALGTLEALAKGFPRGRYAAEVPLLRAESLFELKRYGEAQAEYRKALPAAGNAADRQKLSYNLALAALGAGRPEDALEPLAAAAQGGDAGIAERSLFRLAAGLADLGRGEEALRALADFRNRFAGSAQSEEVLSLQAGLLDRAGRAREAREAFTELLARYPFSPKKDEYLFRRGSSLLASGDSSGALKDFFSLAQAFPDSRFRGEGEYAIGRIYSGRAEYARALPYFKEASQREQASELAGRAILAVGVCLYNTGEYRQSLDWFGRLPEGSAAAAWTAQGWYYAGRAFYKLEDLDRAVERFSRAAAALEGKPEGEEALYWQGVSLFRLNRLGPARGVFLALAERYTAGPRAAEALYRVGVCDALSGEHARAVEAFDRAMAAAKSARSDSTISRRELLQEAQYQKGMSLFQLQNRQEAVKVFQDLARDYPEGNLASEAFLALAQEDFRAEAYAQALSGFRNVIRDYPRRPAGRSALYWAGASAARLDRGDEALDYLLRYLEGSPGGGLAKLAEEEIRAVLVRAGASQQGDGELADFLKRVESASLPPALKNQARFEYARWLFGRDRAQALAMLLRLKESGLSEPQSSEASLLIGEAFRLRGELSRALDVFSGITAARSGVTAATAQLGIARIRVEQGRREEAVEEYLKVFFLYPEAGEQAQEGLYQAGRLYWEGGRRDEARKLFARLLQRYPDSPWRSKLPSD
jgi:TolA-binding protein